MHYIRSMLILSQQLSNKFKIKLPPPPSRFQEISLFLVFLLTNTCFSYTSVEQNTFQKISNTTVFMHYIRSMLILSQQLSNKFKIKLPPPPSRFQEISLFLVFLLTNTCFSYTSVEPKYILEN